MNQIDIYGDIGESLWGDSISANDVKSALSGMTGDVLVRINSAGGSVFDGFAIYNLLREYKGSVTVKIDALAASAASVVAMAGDSIEMADNALFMMHNPWTFALGESKDMIKTAELLDKIRDSIVATYKVKTDLSSDEISDMMDQETWLSADEAIEKGFVTSKSSESAEINNKIEKPWMNRVIEPQEKQPDMAFLNIQKRKLKLLQADA